MKLLIHIVFLLFLLPSAMASTASDVQQGKQPELMLRDMQDGQFSQAPQLDTQVQMDINGMIARVVVRQRFSNPTAKWQEGIYVFPLPDTAAVDHMRMWIGERFIEGDIEEKQAAEKIYQQAKQDGKQAGLVQQERSNVFTTSVANIAPQDEIVIEIEYQQDVQYAEGRFSLRFPMVVAPRYVPGNVLNAEISQFSGTGWAQDTDQVPDASRVTPPVGLDLQADDNPVSLQINLHAGMPLALIDSPYHPIDVSEMAEGSYRILLQKGPVTANRDFALNWQAHSGSEPQAAWFAEQKTDTAAGYYGLLMLMPPSPGQLAVDVPRELILLVDTSGSMHGDSMRQAKAALELAVQGLQPADRFNIIQFNHTTHSLFSESKPGTVENLQLALDYVAGLQADGGTEMLPALQLALDAGGETGLLRQVVFVTDGAVANEQALFQMIRQRLHESRLFTVGIGSAPNSHFMTRAAEAGRGSFTYIGQVQEVQEKMQQLLRKLESPALTDIELDWGQAVQQWPQKVTDLYAGEPVLVSVKSDQPLSGLEVRGMLGEQPWHRSLQLQGGAPAAGVNVLWARKQIRALMNRSVQGADDSERRQSVVQLAKAHHLVSAYTSLVAVDKTPVRPVTEDLDSQAVPVHLPKGWSAKKVFGVLPQTATSAELQLLIGLLLLLLAGLAWFYRPSEATDLCR